MTHLLDDYVNPTLFYDRYYPNPPFLKSLDYHSVPTLPLKDSPQISHKIN
jgi:hypothetical protein